MRRDEGGILTETSKSLMDPLLELFKTIELLAFARKVSIPTTVLNEHQTPKGTLDPILLSCCFSYLQFPQT